MHPGTVLQQPPELTATKAVTSTSAQKGKQAQKPAAQQNASAQQSQAIKQQQSLALVQIMLHASVSEHYISQQPLATADIQPPTQFSTLFYLREYLPLSCFGERDLLKVSRSTSPVSYEDFVSGDTSKFPESTPYVGDNASVGRRRQPLKVILRNRNEKADKVLDILEHGIFEAMEKNFLQAIQLTIFLDKDTPSKVLESYTFTFQYSTEAGDVSGKLASVSLQSAGCTADMQSMRTAKAGLEMIVRSLITLSAWLPILPNQRYMEFHLFYTDDCPPEYEPPGFQRAEHGDLVFPQDDEWCKVTQSCGTMDTGIHSVGLKITSLKWSGQQEADDTGEISEEIGYSDVVPREQFVGIDRVDPLPEIIPTSQNSSQGSSQTRQDEAAKRMLQKMAVPSTPDSSLIPTQARAASFFEDIESDTDSDASHTFHAPELTQEKLYEILEQHRLMSFEKSIDKGSVDEVSCQCGSNSKGLELVQCAYCYTWQHAICYGFRNGQDKRIPEARACYKCLLEIDEKPLLQEMETLVLLRRSLKVILEEGYPNRVRDFAQRLHCNGQTVVQITDLLKKQGFLQATKGSKSKGFLQTGLPKFNVPRSEQVRQRLRKEIFNPLAKISHCYINPDQILWAGTDSAARGKSYMTKIRQRRFASDDSESSLETSNVPNAAAGPSQDLLMDERSQDSIESTAWTTTGASLLQSQSQSLANVTASSSQKVRFANKRPLEDDSSDKENRPLKRRKLSNAGEPIDICEPIEDE